MATDKPAIYDRMVAILKALPAIGKDAQNQGLNFKFRSIDAIINELNPALEKHGVFILPEVRSTHVEAKAKGYAATVEVAYHFVADDGSEVVAVVAGEGHDFADKAVSKAMTMAFKTCLGQVFAISTEDDPDADSVETETSPVPPTRQRAAARSAKTAASPAPPSPSSPPVSDDPGLSPKEALAALNQENFATVKTLPPDTLNDLKREMAEQGIPMDFSAHTEDQARWVADKVAPF